MSNASQVTRNSGNDEWYTPPPIIEAARATMGGIDLDPASNIAAQEWIKADHYFTIEDDALSKNWRGNVWMNPPYSGGKIKPFIDHLCDSFLFGDVTGAIVLTNSATETKWFQHAASLSEGLLLFNSRIKFIPQDGGARKTPLQGQVLFLMGPHLWGPFCNNFKDFGTLLKVDNDEPNT